MANDGVRSSRLLIRRRPRGRGRAPAAEPSTLAPSRQASEPDLTEASSPPSADAVSAGDQSSPGTAPAGSPDAFLVVARVLRAHGTQGEVACELVTEFPQRFRRTKRLFVTP